MLPQLAVVSQANSSSCHRYRRA